jgi:hypothetical protein
MAATGDKVTEEQYANAKEAVKKANFPVGLVNIFDQNKVQIEGYLGVQRQDQKRIISVVSDEYQLLPNKVVFDPVLDFLEKKRVKYRVDRFTSVSDVRSRIHLTFPDIQIKDDTKEGILASMFIHNSYNMTEAFKMTAGAMRQVCKNGMVIGVAIKRLKVIHQAEQIQEIAAANVEALLNGLHDNVKHIENRIKGLRQEKIIIAQLREIGSKFGSGILAYAMKELNLADRDDKNSQMNDILADMSDIDVKMIDRWRLYNIITYYVSHVLPSRYRLDFLQKTSKMFEV